MASTKTHTSCRRSAARALGHGLLAVSLVLLGASTATAQITVTTTDSAESGATYGAYDQDAYVAEGGSLSYDITATGTETTVTLSFAYDSNLTYDSGTGYSCSFAPCSCTVTGNPITCTYPDNPSSATITIPFTVASPYALGNGMLNSTATVSWTSNGGGSASNTEATAVNGTCFREKSGVTQSNICTAGDLTFAVSTVSSVSDGCVSASDTFLSVSLAGSVASTTASRYDIAMYLATDGGDAKTGECYNNYLVPPLATTQPPQNGDGGPYWDLDGQNSCGDTLKNDANEIRYFDQLYIPCTDAWDATTSTNNPDGIVDVGTCGSYWQNALSACDEVEDTPNPTSSKCICNRANLTGVKRPNLSCQGLTCDWAQVRQGWTINCDLQYDNSPVNPGETFGDADYVRFKLDDTVPAGVSSGTFSSASSTVGTDTIAYGASNASLTWTPVDASTTGRFAGGTSTVSRTLSFSYTVPSDAADGDTITIASETYWTSDNTDFDPEVLQSVLSGCSFDLNISPTWVLLSSLDAREAGGRVVVEWESATEAGTVGFDLYRRTENGAWLKVNQDLLPASQHEPGARYRLVDEGAPLGETLVYRLVEVRRNGLRRRLGPFEVRPGDRPAALPLKGAYSVEPHSAPAAMLTRLEAARAATAAAPAPRLKSAPTRAKVSVSETGMQRLEGSEIADALGVTLRQVEQAIKVGKITLTTAAGDQVAWLAAEDGEAILFYGEAADTVFTTTNAYWLELKHGLEMERVDGSGASWRDGARVFDDTAHLERDLEPRTYVTDDPLADYWFWGWVMSGSASGGHKAFTFELPGVAGASRDASLGLTLWGLPLDGDDYAAEVYVNGYRVGHVAWSGDGPYSATLTFSQAAFKEGTNTVELVGEEGFFYVDSFDVAYGRAYRAAGDQLIAPARAATVTAGGFTDSAISVFELADPLRPRLVENPVVQRIYDGSWRASFLAPDDDADYLVVARRALVRSARVEPDTSSDLLDPAAGADYLVIAPRALEAAAVRLADYRAGLGLTTMVVTVETIMDTLNDGLFDPRVIRTFLDHAFHEWSTPPRYVVLAGKGSYDYRDELGLGGDLVPPLMAPTEWGLVASDTAFVDLEGDDGVPEIAIGRIPALTAGELDAYLAKLEAYEASSGGEWADRALLVADDPDDGGEFISDSDALATLLPAGLDPMRIYIGDPFTAEEARTHLLAAFDDGALLLSYVGHAGLDRLASEPLLSLADVPALANDDRLPLISGLTCYLNQFVYPGFASLGEELALHPGGGAIAVYSSSYLSLNDQAVDLGAKLLEALFAEPTPTVGEAVALALAGYAESGGQRDTAATYVLLGDPALRLKDDHR